MRTHIEEQHRWPCPSSPKRRRAPGRTRRFARMAVPTACARTSQRYVAAAKDCGPAACVRTTSGSRMRSRDNAGTCTSLRITIGGAPRSPRARLSIAARRVLRRGIVRTCHRRQPLSFPFQPSPRLSVPPRGCPTRLWACSRGACPAFPLPCPRLSCCSLESIGQGCQPLRNKGRGRETVFGFVYTTAPPACFPRVPRRNERGRRWGGARLRIRRPVSPPARCLP